MTQKIMAQSIMQRPWQMQRMQCPTIQCSDNLMASLGGRILSIDGGIKNTSRVHEGGGRAATCIHTMLNEAKQVVGQVM